jgi:hypothetical protein
MSETLMPQSTCRQAAAVYSSTSATSMLTVYFLPPRVSRTLEVVPRLHGADGTWIFSDSPIRPLLFSVILSPTLNPYFAGASRYDAFDEKVVLLSLSASHEKVREWGRVSLLSVNSERMSSHRPWGCKP